jgi:thiamine-monophosphate kinase
VATLAERGEQWVIAEARRRAGPPLGAIAVGIGDDAAVLVPPPGERILVTQDMLVEGVHFRTDWLPPEVIGRRAAAVNASDIAAMGGTPIAFVAALALPGSLEAPWVERFLDGLCAEMLTAGAPLAGGDTVASPAGITVDITVIGAAADPVLRRGAEPGDLLVLTGTLGGSAAGLALLADGVRWPGRTPAERAAMARHALPTPRIGPGRVLACGAHALTDVSDAFATEVAAITTAYGLGAVVDEGRLPILPEARALSRERGDGVEGARRWALGGGEDYELLAAVPESRLDTVLSRIRATGVALSVVGRVVARPGLWMVRADDGKEVPLDRSLIGEPFEHFGPGRGTP